ncbi:SO2930 family diheme c-type cytochrome [Henriciella marina]|uniref:SO2930 family diheme c-type cytochrome n=1 Tax=Henriciella marina TaxID=453851 RepID=UPI00037F8DEE|nr:SO2930 family diheme c-type cytochrome [Henriciella marina]
MRAAFLAVLVMMLSACGQHQAAGPDMDVVLAEAPARTLAEYGLFTDASARQPAQGVVPYDLINPLFSDHASKHRLVYVPDGKAADYRADEVMEFPVGTVLVKTFAFAPDMRAPDVGERYRETRLLIRKADGWAAYPYVWNEEETEARYSPAGAWLELAFIDPAGEAVEIDYRVPNQNQCKTCHQMGDAIEPIGPKARNLNHQGPAGVNQIEDWSARGMLTGVPGDVPAVPDITDASLSVPERARAYLDINCAHCHRAEGSASNSGLWLGWEVSDPVKIGIGKHPTAAGRGSGDAIYVVAPGAPEASILTYRMNSDEAGIAMPELGRALIDGDGVELVREWIAGMD